ncbi:DUF3862 domain-containing protein [Enterococcus pallens]|uniref:DUF3862 domain-containing protein n=1 Tax=Enterococcus pallens ATCC BAA-351 TaxID=1158607 RepID=R2SYT6_9ENTE|nr:DUF3862 domain-containing protein [Enterococcus pallens]EOH93204.1 hypothetical protein UAU_02847 [Enterococcus pallens ATCC BAA-351]EOU24990.1 hypothetical protein I588_00978 [Enterococcus pallens ATCC BAA-351]
MRKWNKKFYRDKYFWIGILCITLAVASYTYFKQPVHSVTNTTSTSGSESSELGDHVNEKIGSVSELRESFEAIQVGNEKTGEGGSTKKQINSSLGSPNMKMEDYLEGEKVFTYTWHNFPWESPMPMLSVSYKNDKVVNKSLYFSNEKMKDQLFNQAEFDGLQLTDTYTREDLVERFGYPDLETVAHSEMGVYEYYNWFRSNGTYSINLQDNQLKEKRHNTD